MACFSVFGAILGCFWRFWGAKPALFFVFCCSVTPPRGRWDFGVTTHLLNVSGHRRRLVRRTVERLVRIALSWGGCAGLKLSEACARGVSGAMARGWSTPQSLPRVAVPTGLLLGNRRTRGGRLESVFCCFAVRSSAYSLLPNVSDEAEAACRR